MATLIRLTGDFDLAEDAVQEAAVVALEQWGVSGVPDNPGAWLTTVARRKALDRLRRESSRTARESAAVRLLDDPVGPGGAVDERPDELRLLFTCCHPALNRDARVALTMRTLCGLTTSEIARVLLSPEPTVGQRISRAKKKIRTARIPYRVPEDHELPERLPAVLDVLYLVFTAGHHATEGSLDSRFCLADDAVRIARSASASFPDEPEVWGLLALMLATHARRNTRVDGAGDVILLADQDRTRWDHAAIAESSRLVEVNLQKRRAGPFQIQAAIASLHGLASTFESTDWPQIAELYGFLERLRPTPVIRVNRAVAVAFANDPQAGLDVLDTLGDDELAEVHSWHLYWSTRADFFRRLGNHPAAAGNYRRALACPTNEADRRFLERRLREAEGEDQQAAADRGPHARPGEE